MGPLILKEIPPTNLHTLFLGNRVVGKRPLLLNFGAKYLESTLKEGENFLPVLTRYLPMLTVMWPGIVQEGGHTLLSLFWQPRLHA